MSKAPPTAELPQQLLLCIFIHGFKGTDETFGAFPEQLKHEISETITGHTVECITYPKYKTKGELTAAVEHFADWLTTLTAEREVFYGLGGGAGEAKVVLCGHSMGGLLATDTFLAMAHTRQDKTVPLWPRIIACIAFDTPYLGIHPGVLKNPISEALEYVAHEVPGILRAFSSGKKVTDPNPLTVPSSTSSVTAPPPGTPPGKTRPVKRRGWQRWAPIVYGAGAVVLVGAAACTAYHKRDKIRKWATDHMQFVKVLWDEKALNDRFENVVNTGAEVGVLSRTFYTHIPCKSLINPIHRTFVTLPQPDSPYRSYFVPAHNTIAQDEITAHLDMFEADSNDGYYELGQLTAQAIRDGMMLCKDP